ncbi:MAG: hypothetical protein FJ100_11175 [Deltaproteobacteria bacterium]|nr:hypothetical protein [Deltaproteobacteria bacterium]
MRHALVCVLSALTTLVAAQPACAEEHPQVVRSHANGKPAVIQYWEATRHIRDEQFDVDGARTLEVKYSTDGRRLEWSKLRKDGSVAAQWATEDGVRNGDELLFDEAGNRVGLVPWRAGKRHGRAQEFNKDGKVVAEITWRDDTVIGPQVTFYDTGERRSLCALQDLRRHGIETVFAKAGWKMAEIPYRHGLIDGEARYFAESGYVSAILVFRQSKAVGSETQFYPSGRKKQVIPVRADGTRDGDAMTFREDGGKSGYIPYRDGVPHGWEMRLDHGGSKIAEAEWRHGEACCAVKHFWPSGRLRIVQEHVDASRDGTETHYFDQPSDGKPIRHLLVPLVQGRKHGKATVFYENGSTVWSELEYVDDLREGVETRYYDSSEKLAEYQWRAGEFVGKARTYWKNGRIQSAFPFDGGAGTGMESRFDEQGRLRMQVALVKGKKQGEAKVFDERGELVATLTYLDDQQDGPETRYRSGKPTGVWLWKAGELVSSPPEALAADATKAPVAGAGTPKAATDKHASAEEAADAAKAVGNVAQHQAAAVKGKAVPTGKRVGDPDGVVRTYWPNGKLQSAYPLRGKGTEVQFHDNGEVQMVVPVLEGVRTGIARIFDRSGLLWAQVEFVKGKKEGDETRFGRGGEKVARLPFRNGGPVGIAKTYYPDGTLQSEYHHDSSLLAGTEIQYHRSGGIRMYVPLRFGKRNGTATIYTEAGIKWAEVPWRDGKRDGEELRFDRAGLVILRIRWTSDREARL